MNWQAKLITWNDFVARLIRPVHMLAANPAWTVGVYKPVGCGGSFSPLIKRKAGGAITQALLSAHS